MAAGLDKGVKRLSELNMFMAGLLFLFVLIAGPTLVILLTMGNAVVDYLRYLPALSNWVDREDTAFLHGWTTFYWAWWISWSPFVGMFIARISKGRSVREFLFGVILIPTLLSFVWMSVFGGSALYVQSQGIIDLAAAVNEDVATAMFVMLSSFPFSAVLSLVAVVLVAMSSPVQAQISLASRSIQ